MAVEWLSSEGEVLLIFGLRIGIEFDPVATGEVNLCVVDAFCVEGEVKSFGSCLRYVGFCVERDLKKSKRDCPSN